MTVLDYLFAFVPMLGILIFVHELGHFLVAKACGVRVLKFSLGFGPPVGIGRWRMRWERNGTEYVVAWFPLGGFVKMLGENLMVQGEDDQEAVANASPDEYLSAKPTWQKLAIVLAGPAMNLLLPVVAFVGVLAVGIPRPASVVGMVEQDSPAAAAGVEAGDRIAAIDGTAVEWWEEVERAIRHREGGHLALSVERGDESLTLRVPIELRRGLDEFGSAAEIGWIGLGYRRLPALVGVPSSASLAARAGLQSGDRVESVGGSKVEDWEALTAAYDATLGNTVDVAVIRGESETAISLSLPKGVDLASLGVVPATILVSAVSEGFPADLAGVQPGDLIVAVDSRPVGSFLTFQETVRSSGGGALTLTIARDGGTLDVTLQPEERMSPGPMGIEEKKYLIGITHALATLPGTSRTEVERNPLVSIPRAVELTVDRTAQFLRGFGKILTGEIGRDKLAGPIGIAEIARSSLDMGWLPYLYTMILISINLGILNLMPIPILDGGQALIFAVEGVKRSPISLRTREIVQQLGLTMILMLMGLAFWNDISRNWSRFLEWLTGTGT